MQFHTLCSPPPFLPMRLVIAGLCRHPQPKLDWAGLGLTRAGSRGHTWVGEGHISHSFKPEKESTPDV